MATRGDSKGFVSTPLEEKGARQKDSYFLARDENASELKDTDAELKYTKQTFYESLVTDVREAFQRANPQEAHRPFDVSHSGDQQISQSSKSPHSTQPTWICGSTDSKHNSMCIRSRTMTRDTD